MGEVNAVRTACQDMCGLYLINLHFYGVYVVFHLRYGNSEGVWWKTDHIY